jgi:hypothetical protein
MTPKLKVCVTTWYSGRPNDRPFIERTTDVHGYLHQRFNFDALGLELTEDDPEYCVVLNHPNDDFEFDPERTLGVVTEPTWSNNVDCAFLNERCARVLTHFAFPFRNAVRGYGLGIPWVTTADVSDLPKKSRKLSIVASPLRLDRPHTNYDFRHELVKSILASDIDCDIYGDWPGTDSRLMGPVEDKVDALAPYEFSVAIENCCEPGYVTEKLFDCFLCGTTPVYLGDPLVRKRFGENASVRLLPSPLDTLRAISRGETEHHGDAVESARSTYLQTANLFLQLRRVIDGMTRSRVREQRPEEA